ncbi:MAG: BMP family ABC transporter substrate-binding protein, partial [Acidimicrobiia bacterium]|nr:BMP family ABC transporter substrate-binding protein [Acidimicrobiia bacterium]
MRKSTRHTKRFGLLAALLAVALVAAACGGDDEDTSAGAPPPAPPAETEAPPAASDDAPPEPEPSPMPSGPLRVAVVAPSASNDLAFTQSIVDGVAALGAVRELEVEVTDGTFVVEDAAVAIREYAEAGFDLVIAHGSQYGGSLQEIAPDFPDVSFAWGTSVDTFGLANVFAYTAASDQGGYVLGSMAAALTDTGIIGVVGPIEVGDAKLFVDGFVVGAGDQDSSVDVNVVYTESFSDVAKAAETAEAHVSQGADVMTGTAQMVVGAVGVAQRE